MNPRNLIRYLTKPPRVVEDSLSKIKIALRGEVEANQKEFLKLLPFTWIEVNADAELLSYHPQAVDFLKIPLPQLMGRKIFAQIRDWEPRQYFESFSDQAARVDLGLVGDRHWRFYKVPRRDSSSELSYLVFLEDRSDWIRLKKHRKEFVANVSHELKTPLTIMKGSIDTLLESEDLPILDRKHFLELIGRNTDHLMKSVDALLLLARIEEGTQSFPRHSQKMKALLEEVLAWYTPLAQSKKISLNLEVKDESINLEIASSLMQKALANLIENAIKHNPPKTTVTLALSMNNDKNYVLISIKDDGVGVPESYQKRIFERFFRLKNTLVPDVEGSGLGLALVKHIAELHNGRCELLSAPNQGSEFVLKLPVNTRA